MAETDVLYQKQDHIATITLNRPDMMNAVNWEIHDLIDQALDDAGRDDNVRVLILPGAACFESLTANFPNTSCGLTAMDYIRVD